MKSSQKVELKTDPQNSKYLRALSIGFGTVYRQTVYRHPVYRQPVYRHPVYRLTVLSTDRFIDRPFYRHDV